MWIKFANLCRKSDRKILAEKTLNSLLGQVGEEEKVIFALNLFRSIELIIGFDTSEYSSTAPGHLCQPQVHVGSWGVREEPCLAQNVFATAGGRSRARPA